MNATQTQIKLGGMALEVVQLAPSKDAYKHAPTIVFLHEGLGSVSMWRDFPARLCATTGCAGLVYSRTGYGQSDSVPDVRNSGRLQPDYMHRQAWDVLPALLDALHILHPILLGHSDGASIALLYASKFSAEGCIAMAPHLFVEDMTIKSIEAAQQTYLHTDMRNTLARFHQDVDCAFWQWNDVWLSVAFRNFNIEAECAQITCPVLAIQGYDDPYGSMAQIDTLALSNMRRQLLKLEQCGHSPHKDHMQKVLQAVADWHGALRAV